MYSGITREIREKAIDNLLFYAADDVDTTKKITERMPFIELMVQMKNVLPYCTYSEIAFSVNCMNKAHEYRYFKSKPIGHLPYYGYNTKIREDERRIFKKRFPTIKRDRLRDTSKFVLEKVVHRNVDEYYFSLEEALWPIPTILLPQLGNVYDWAIKRAEQDANGREQLFAALMYHRPFVREILTDYYFASRDKSVFDLTVRLAGEREVAESQLLRKFWAIEPKLGWQLLKDYEMAFKYMKNHFRSIYVALAGERRKLIRPTKNRLEEVYYPDFMIEDADLFLLRDGAEQIRPELSEGQQRNLSSFLTFFNNFEQAQKAMSSIIYQKELAFPLIENFNLLYSFLYHRRFKKSYAAFKRKYLFSIPEMTAKIEKAYKSLAERAAELGRVVDFKGDYIFISRSKGEEGDIFGIDTPPLYKVRHLDSLEVGKKREIEEDIEEMEEIEEDEKTSGDRSQDMP